MMESIYEYCSRNNISSVSYGSTRKSKQISAKSLNSRVSKIENKEIIKEIHKKIKK